jgi:hypothetical protein
MNTSTLLTNFKYIVLGLVVAMAFGVTHAQFVGPTTTPPSGNIDVPIHTGPDQVKNGGLSVNTFLANENAQFKQETFLNGTVFGGSPGGVIFTVPIGDSTAPANIAVNGNLSAVTLIQSTSVQNGNSSNLCATTNGTIVLCSGTTSTGGSGGTGGSSGTPSFVQIGNPTSSNTTYQQFQIGSSVAPGDTFSISAYYHTVTVTAVSGDNAETIVQKLILAINNTTDAQWRENPYLGTTSHPGDPNVAPASGTSGYPPHASSNVNNATFLIVILDASHQMYAAGALSH